MPTRGLDWIDELPPELAGQRALLRGLLALCDADDQRAVLPSAMALPVNQGMRAVSHSA